MSKKGGSKHFVRMRAAKSLGVVSRKKIKWLLAPAPGKHKKAESISAGVLVRDVLHTANDLREVKKIFNAGAFMVDGKKIKETKYSVGLMDIISEPMEKKTFRMSLNGENLVPKEVKSDAAAKKYLMVIRKHTVKGGKTNLTFHDGRNFLTTDIHIKAGDTCVFSVPEFKLLSHIKLEQGAVCLVTHGKHIGEVAKLEKIIERPGSHESEALLAGAAGQFVTIARYLFPVDSNYA